MTPSISRQGVKERDNIDGWQGDAPHAALCTGVGLLPGVDAPVLVQGRDRGEALGAEVAAEGPLPGVGADVDLEQRDAVERLAAVVALVLLAPRHLPRVGPQVLPQVVLHGQGLTLPAGGRTSRSAKFGKPKSIDPSRFFYLTSDADAGRRSKKSKCFDSTMPRLNLARKCSVFTLCVT